VFLVAQPWVAVREAWAREMACTTAERTRRGKPSGRGSVPSCLVATTGVLRDPGGDVLGRDRIALWGRHPPEWCYSEGVKTVSRTPSVNDTSDAAAEAQIQALRAMPASRKVGLVEDANRTARHLALAGIGLRFPEASMEERVRLLMDVLLGVDLAVRVYGPRTATSGR
jgi:hypothetical protein